MLEEKNVNTRVDRDGLATLCDGVSDIIMGRIVDKTMGRRSGLISAAEHSRALH